MKIRHFNRRRRKRRYLTRHHNLAKSLGGKLTPGNTIILDNVHHQHFHQLFGNRTITQAIAVLQRLEDRRKRR